MKIHPISRCLQQHLIAIFVLALAQSGWSTELPRYFGLTILHTNDIHGHLFPVAYPQDGKMVPDVGGAARRATLVREIKADSRNPVLVMDAGDLFTRGPISDQNGVPDFDVANTIPYDVMTLGNNEFAEGQHVMFDRIKQARFPIVTANVFFKSSGKPIVPTYRIFDYYGVKIGVFGLTAPRVAGYSQAEGLEVRDPIEAAKIIVPVLREQADFVVALTHIGYDLDRKLAAVVPGIDVIIGGDSHTWLPQPTLVADSSYTNPAFYIGGTLVCQDGEWGVCVDELVLRLRRSEGHRYRVMSYSAKLIDVDSSIPSAPDVDKLLDRYTKPLQKELAHLDQEVLLADAPAWMARCFREVAGTQIGATNIWTIEEGLSSGSVTELDIRKTCPFQRSHLIRLVVTGKQLKGLIAKSEVEVSGAQLRDGQLYVGEEKASDDQTYSLSIAGFNDEALKDAKQTDSGISIQEAVVKYINSKKS